MIVEFGVTGTPTYRAQWLKSMLSSLYQFPHLKHIMFFNAPDTPGAWGEAVETPDWTLSQVHVNEQLASFLQD